MVTRKRPLPAGSTSLVVSSVVVGAIWLGCARGADPASADADVPPSLPPTVEDDAAARPDFEAGFPDAGKVDATPEGGGGVITCIDTDDPGGTEVTAEALPDTTDAQNTALSVQGTISSAVDVDFYKMNVADTSLHTLQPNLAIATAGAEMCVYVSCINGTGTNFLGCTDGEEATSEGGESGCCAIGPANVNPSWSCDGTSDDSGRVVIRIKESTDTCLSYAFSYAF